MSYLIDFLTRLEEGARITGAWLDKDSDAIPAHHQLSAHLVLLPDGGQGQVECTFVAAHMPLCVGGCHGVDADGSQWMLFLQSAPPDDDEPWRPFEIMSEQVQRLLPLTQDWTVVEVAHFAPREILIPYLHQGIKMDDLLEWPLRDVIGGLITELMGFPLHAVAQGRLTRCAFPAEDHDCRQDAVDDLIARWGEGDTAPPG